MINIHTLLSSGKEEAARQLAMEVLTSDLGLSVAELQFTQDEYSLNSVSGRVNLSSGETKFFKFHTEEYEERNISEYYRAEVLHGAGLPVDTPVAVSSAAGRQIALYDLRTEPRLADICFDLEKRFGQDAQLMEPLVRARRDLDRRQQEVMQNTLRQDSEASVRSAIHQLFYHRLAGPEGRFPGSRYEQWYVAPPQRQALTSLSWTINGVQYRNSLARVAKKASQLLAPSSLATDPVVLAHGDDHNGNVWVLGQVNQDWRLRNRMIEKNQARLKLFDPAFAGSDIPVLLAPIKATYHNVFAHPFWLYHPSLAAQRYSVSWNISQEEVNFEDDQEATLSPLRQEILDSITENIWIPQLIILREQGLLRSNWRQVLRAGLSLCPFLVTNLMDVSRETGIRMLGLSRVILAGCEPSGGSDVVSDWLDTLEAAIR